MKQYRVIAQESCHYGDVGTLLDKAEARRRLGVNYAGRGRTWYASWDVLLNFSGSPSDIGTGFNWNEIEEVE